MKYGNSYITAKGFIIGLQIDSIGENFRASTNDFDFYNENKMDDLEWKSLEEAQKDLNEIAKRNKLNNIFTPYLKKI